MTKTAFTSPVFIAAASIAAACVLLAMLLLAPAQVHAQSGPSEPASPPAELGTVIRSANLRAGPGTKYAIVGSAPAGSAVRIAGTNKAGDWYHLSSGRWIAAFLVDTDGATSVQASAAGAASAVKAPVTATATPVPPASEPHPQQPQATSLS